MITAVLLTWVLWTTQGTATKDGIYFHMSWSMDKWQPDEAFGSEEKCKAAAHAGVVATEAAWNRDYADMKARAGKSYEFEVDESWWFKPPVPPKHMETRVYPEPTKDTRFDYTQYRCLPDTIDPRRVKP